MKRLKLALFMVMGLLCLLLLPISSASASETESVNVGLYGAPRYAYVNDDGSFAGADVEYAYRIAQRAGLDINITLYQNEKEMLADLDSENVDMLFDFGKTEEREQDYLFSENPIGSTAQSIYVRTGDDRFTYGDISKLAGKVFGYSMGNNIGNIFQEWCESHGFTPEVVEYQSTDAVDAALDSGEIDAGIISQNGHEGYTTVQTFSSQSYYIIFRKDGTELKNKVDSAMTQILAIEPFYEEQLLNKYDISTMGYTGFSAEEKEYIAAHANIRVAVVKDDYPYYSQTSGGGDQGIIPDYYSAIAEFTGFTFSYQVYDTSADAIAAVKDGQADILAMFSDGVITATDDKLLLTDAYDSVDAVLLTRAGTSMSQIGKIAVKQRSVNNVKQGIPSQLDAEIVPVANAKLGFDAMKKGEVDAVLCGLPTATWLLNQTNSAAYSTSVISSIRFDLCGATANDNMVLASIFDKAISATNYSFGGIVEDNTVQENTWETAIARIPPTQIALISVLFIVIIVVLVLALISIIRRQKEKAIISAAKAENEKRQLQLEAFERNTEERNRFFSDVSHDMRTPLTAILGFSDLIESETDLDEIKAYNGKIRNSGKLLLELINDTLTLSKVGSNKLTLSLAPADSEHLFDSVITPIRETAKAKNITFTVDQSHIKRRMILVDTLNIQKIMLNLLSNAVKYTPEGGKVELMFINEPEDSDNPDSLFIIRDDGIGMSEEFQQHMFEPFSQERRTGYGGTGTGLGLSIVQQLVALMDGTIEVQSEKNEGTTVTVRFHFQEVETDDSVSAAERSLAGDQGDLKGKRVLLCEDNVMNQEIAKTLLESKGVSVIVAENGQVGVRRFSESEPGEYAAILMDLRMPVMDGYEATRAIRALDRTDAEDIPIIAMTADAFEDDIRKCLDAGMDAHVAKPIDSKQLFQTLSGRVGRRRKEV